jgi:hypothetical protein
LFHLAVGLALIPSSCCPVRCRCLEWAQGIPALVRRLPELLDAAAPTSIDDTDKLLWSLRDGWLSTEQERERLLEWAGLEVFDVARLTDPTLPMALMLFHEYLAVSDWQTFCQLMAAQGWNLGQDDPARVLTEQLTLGVAAGLACQHGTHGFRLHPLAPAALRQSFEIILTQSTQGDPDRFALVRKRLWAVYVQTVRLSPQVLGLALPPRPGTLGLARRAQRQNLAFATQVGVKGAWWALALPIARRLRDELLAERRADEWPALFNRIVTLYREYPPTESEMGLENVPMLMTKLHAEEAERAGDLAEARRLREQATRQAFARDLTLTVEPTGPEDGSAEATEPEDGSAEPDDERAELDDEDDETATCCADVVVLDTSMRRWMVVAVCTVPGVVMAVRLMGVTVAIPTTTAVPGCRSSCRLR